MGTWADISKLLLIARVFTSLPIRTVDTGTLLSCEDVAAVATVMAVAAVLRGDGIMGNLSVFLECKLTTESMITSNKYLTISGTELVFSGTGKLIVITILLLIAFKDALTPD